MEWKYQTIEREGFNLQVAKNNTDGPSLFWIGSALYYPRVIPEEISEKYQITVVDQRGFAKRIGKKVESKEDYFLEKLLDDFVFLQTELKVPTCPIVGHSGHGYMALSYAAKYPEKAKSLVMISTGPSHGTPMLEAEVYFQKYASGLRKEAHLKNLSEFQKNIERTPEDFFIHYCVSLEAKGFYKIPFPSRTFWEGIHTNKLAFDYLFGEVFRDIAVSDFFKKLSIPTWICMGKEDYQVAPYYTWDPILKEFPEIKMTVMEESSHLPFFERPEEFLNQLEICLD
ncbi:alpha/beta fold hydrolase [Leptospira kanakyensis]|uniref:Alpha/beta hydrolase n=1 Tax=Leptospira kanakyensis TaxID=2484968 RepID=A0A6N4Q5B8_9LEPT|nr:alpha/beta hydrolase [Leptospira kanakyensis]MCW7481276.1 alpha/beta hydrolase [Leptospira kanakyensis]TGK46089.1 alpha/beta hydrolase [Leptospira kanakyensis]TGK65026.1 alpha/beta hydrolase [Leptospira kanakyensis]TGK65458.1 alpha/beta hydrolase [Leptospira kanakyensis]